MPHQQSPIGISTASTPFVATGQVINSPTTLANMPDISFIDEDPQQQQQQQYKLENQQQLQTSNRDSSEPTSGIIYNNNNYNDHNNFNSDSEVVFNTRI